jgi:outer membrane protein assembly factor BamB
MRKSIVIATAAIVALGVILWFAFRNGPLLGGRAGPKPKWTLKVGRVIAPPAIDLDGRIQLVNEDGDLLSVDPSGQLFSTRHVGPPHRQAEAPAVGTDGALYVVTFGKVVIFNRSGTLRSESPIGVRGGGLGVALTDDRMCADCGRSGGCAFSLDPVVDMVWQILESRPGAPLIHRDGTILFGGQTLVAVTGAIAPIRWIVPRTAQLEPDMGHSGWYEMVQNGSLNIQGLAAGKDETTYVATEHALIALNGNGEEQWRLNAWMAWGHQPVVAADGTIYFDGEDLFVYAVRSNGKLLWKVQNTGHSSQLILGSSGTLFFSDLRDRGRGLQGVLRAVDSAGHEKWIADLDSEVSAAPTLGRDGTLYVATHNGTLYAFPVGETLMRSPWPKFQGNLRNSGQADTE